MNYYNEFDPKIAAWLKVLIDEKHIPNGHIDQRSITEVSPDDLRGFDQCHFFAGIGGWPLALRLAGWPESRPVWTGSCPCQPLSVAGLRKGHADERHLWPAFYSLISKCKVPVIFGEQVASKDGREWFSGVRADLEGMGYAVGGADLCAAGVGAPHIRQRLYWVAESSREFIDGKMRSRRRRNGFTIGSTDGRMGEPIIPGLEGHSGNGDNGNESGRNGAHEIGSVSETSAFGPGMADSDDDGCRTQGTGGPGGEECDAQHGGSNGGLGVSECSERRPQQQCDKLPGGREQASGGLASASWSDFIWLDCRDGKQRRTKPGIHPLADGIPGRVGLLRGYGNAIVPPLAKTFIESYLEIEL